MIHNSLYALQVTMSSQQFPRSGAPPTSLGPAPPISTGGSTGLINPTTTGRQLLNL